MGRFLKRVLFMGQISRQTSLQAAEIIKTAKSSNNVELTVSWSNNVRVMSGLPLMVAKLMNRIDPDAREKRIEEAERVVSEKLEREFAALGMSQQVRQSFDSKTIATELIEDPTISDNPKNSSTLQPEVEEALADIKKIGNKMQGEDLRSVWSVINQKTSPGSKANVDEALEVISTAKQWGKELKLEEKSALQLSNNAYKLSKSKNISLNNAKEILLCSGKLISEHHLKPDDALDYAIEINELYKGKANSLNNLREISNSLIGTIPELGKTSDQMKLSAGICCLQLKKRGLSDEKIHETIRLRLSNRKFIQSKLPSGMKIESIHQGAHLRLKRSLGKQELEQLTNRINDTTGRETEHSSAILQAAPKFSKMDPQFGYDAHRAAYELKNNNIPVQAFTSLEQEKRAPKPGLPFKILGQWLDELISFAGGETAASACSAFISQTLFADLTRSTGRSQSIPGMMHSAAGESGTTSFIYRLLKSDTPDSKGILVHNTLMQNATTLKFDRDFLENEEPTGYRSTTKPFDIPLIENAGHGAKARQDAFTVKYDFKGNISDADLKAGKQYCKAEEATIEYDLILHEAELDAKPAPLK